MPKGRPPPKEAGVSGVSGAFLTSVQVAYISFTDEVEQIQPLQLASFPLGPPQPTKIPAAARENTPEERARRLESQRSALTSLLNPPAPSANIASAHDHAFCFLA